MVLMSKVPGQSSFLVYILTPMQLGPEDERELGTEAWDVPKSCLVVIFIKQGMGEI